MPTAPAAPSAPPAVPSAHAAPSAHPAAPTAHPAVPTAHPAVPTAHPAVPTAHPAALHAAVLQWYATHRRDLPWREPGTSAWAVLVSEVMLQQTPVRRVEPAWRAWVERWPTPHAQATATPAEVVRMWGALGYPRRALRLLDCARAVVERHGGAVPRSSPELRALPGVGAYTAAAVEAFAFGGRTVVLDTNVRRVLARLVRGEEHPGPAATRAERARAEAILPSSARESASWNVALMELGALVCTARRPRCDDCPVASRCRWRAAGRPAAAGAAGRRAQPWQGTDRQARGALLAAMRALDEGRAVSPVELEAAWPPAEQRRRALASLVVDGLAEPVPGGFRLPTAR